MAVKVLIAEDSAFQRKVIADMLSEHQDIEIVGAAKNGEEAIKMVIDYDPDVLLLDLLMPKMDGLTAFKYLIKEHPIPTIIFSSFDPSALDISVQALLEGAFDYIIKPGGIWKIEFPKFKDELISKILLASKSKEKINFVRSKKKIENFDIKHIVLKESIKKEKVNFDKPREKYVSSQFLINSENIKFNVIVIGTSVGGPKTLKLILKSIPSNFPSPILIVQHLDAYFMEKLANSLNDLCKIKVKIAEHEEDIRSSTIYLAPGGKHMDIIVKNNRPTIRIFNGAPINFCKPSIDPLFISAAHIFKDHVMGIILTGLGNDGVEGLKIIRNEGGKTIAESKETCIVYGMPKIAIKSGAAQLSIPNYEIKKYIIKFGKKLKKELKAE